MAVSRPRASARLIRMISIVSLAAAVSLGASAPVEAGDGFRSRVTTIAKAQRGDPWVFGAEGPARFDCSGLVYFAYRRAGVLEKIGGRRDTVDGYWRWFAQRGRASKWNGRRGDLVIWGRNGRLDGTHIGIYLGRGRAVSTLMNGVQVHPLHGLTDEFVTFLHVR